MFLNSINHFRALAILVIVAGHCYSLAGWNVSSYFEKVVANLVTGGTALFVFISGLLFHHVFYKKFDYGRFLRKKISYVLVPYLALSSATVLFYLSNSDGHHGQYYFTDQTGLYYEYVRPAFLYLWTGGVNLAYWYIPFIMVIFAMSPLFIAYIHLTPKMRLYVFGLLLAVSMLIHRPVDNVSVMQSVFYYMPVYMFGIMASIHRDRIYSALSGRELYLALVILSLATIQAFVFENYGNFHKPPFEAGPPDIVLLQKLLICLFLMVWLHRLENWTNPLLEKLAQGSFAIFFLHPFIIEWLDQGKLSSWVVSYIGIPGVVRWVMATLLVLVASISLALVIRGLMPKLSRKLIGW